MQHDYLTKILNARVYEAAVETPLELAPNLSHRLGNRFYFKREDMQPVFSFKLRGAYNKIAHLTPAQLQRGVICASAGNHAQGVALSAAKIGCRAVIVMPTTTPQIKVQAVASRGGEVVLAGESYDEAYAHAVELEKAEKLTFVHPFDDPYVIAGQGTIGMEILRQHGKPIHAVFVAIGGGGLAAGVAAYIKAVRPEIKVIGVETFDADAMKQSIAAGKRVRLDNVGLFADGTAVKFVGEETFRVCREYLDDIILVDTDAICAAIKDVFEDTRSILEPSGALAIAGAKEYAKQHKLKDKSPGGRGLRRQYQFRPPALRRRAGRGGRAAGGGAGRDPAGEARRLQEVRLPHRQPQHHRIQLPLPRGAGSPRLRRRAGGQPGRIHQAGGEPEKARLCHTGPDRRRKWASCTCATWSAAMRPRWRTSCCTASSSRNGPAP